MGTKASMPYAPEQDRVEDKAGATRHVDQRVREHLLDDFHPKPALQKKAPSQPQTDVLEIWGQERRDDFSRERQPRN